MQLFDVSFAIRRGAPAPVPRGGCEESLFEKGVLLSECWSSDSGPGSESLGRLRCHELRCLKLLHHKEEEMLR